MSESGPDTPRGDFRRFVGIDLGGGRGKNTAVARVELQGGDAGGDAGNAPAVATVVEAALRRGRRGSGAQGPDALFRDDVLVEYLDTWVDDRTMVAINAPLTLPPCIRCTLPCPTVLRCEVPVVQWMRTWGPKLNPRGRGDRSKPAVTPYTQRATDVLLHAEGIRPREALGQGSGPLAARAAYLRRVLSPKLRLHENLIEVDPRATLVRILGRSTDHRARLGEATAVWEVRKQVLSALTDPVGFEYVWPELVVRNTHVFHAVVCAITGFLWATAPLHGPVDLLGAEQPAAEPRSTADEAAADRMRRLRGAVAALGELWLTDGWIWAPPSPKPGPTPNAGPNSETSSQTSSSTA